MRNNINILPAPKLSRAEIVEMAEVLSKEFWQEWGRDIPNDLVTINFDVVYDNFIYPKYEIIIEEGLKLGFDDAGEKILARFLPSEKLVQIDDVLHPRQQDPRRVFTLWHEVAGHGILQGDFLRRFLGGSQLKTMATTDGGLSPNTEKCLEWQANVFAANMAAPNWLVAQAILSDFDPYRPIMYCGPSWYSLSVRGGTVFRFAESYDGLCREIARSIQFRFGGLSLECIGYRIAEIGFVIDKTMGIRLHRTEKSVLNRRTSSIRKLIPA